jgi:hypothetical protein
LAVLVDRPAQAMARAILAPTSNACVLLNAAIAPRRVVVPGILREATRIPAGHPALLRCMVSVADRAWCCWWWRAMVCPSRSSRCRAARAPSRQATCMHSRWRG